MAGWRLSGRKKRTIGNRIGSIFLNSMNMKKYWYYSFNCSTVLYERRKKRNYIYNNQSKQETNEKMNGKKETPGWEEEERKSKEWIKSVGSILFVSYLYISCLPFRYAYFIRKCFVCANALSSFHSLSLSLHLPFLCFFCCLCHATD